MWLFAEKLQSFLQQCKLSNLHNSVIAVYTFLLTHVKKRLCLERGARHMNRIKVESMEEIS
jgi:hypothetical protein